MPQSAQHVEEIPTVQTKAKMNMGLSRGASNFGVESMFESSSRGQPFADQDAPPTMSIHDSFNDPNFGMSERTFQRSMLGGHNRLNSSTSRTPQPESSQQSQTYYVIVFGYPPDKYSLTVEYFQGIGEATHAERHTELVNCFRIGYKDPAEAIRAVRRNGEVLSGSWMIGVKWEDPLQADALGLSMAGRTPKTPEFGATPSPNGMSVDTSPLHDPHSSIGTPIKLAPPMSAFRQGGSQPSPRKPSTPQFKMPAPAAPGHAATPSKSMIGQVSDLLFGW